MSSTETATAEVASPPGYTSVKGAANYTSLSAVKLRNLIREKRLQAHRVGDRILIAYRDLDRMVCST